ncbi:MAG: AAA family ATPase [Hyphomicrobium sp.]
MSKHENSAKAKIWQEEEEARSFALENADTQTDVDVNDNDLPDEEDAPTERGHKPRQRPDAPAAILGAVFDSCVSKAVQRRLAHGQALAVVVIVPGPSWKEPFASFFRKKFGDRWHIVTKDSGLSDNSSADLDIARRLTSGHSVIGFATDPEKVPHTLAAAADMTIRLAAPDGPVLEKAIRRFTLRGGADLANAQIAGLDLNTIISAFRPACGPARIAQRLVRVRAARSEVATSAGGVPDLASAYEYGAARIWGMNLACDVADLRAGRLDWESLPKGIVLHSEPGLGKSLYSKALASYCDIPIVTTSVADWFMASQRGYLDQVIRAMRESFDAAQSLAELHGASLIFIDELDGIPNRATLDDRNADYWRPFCNDVLLRLDRRKNVVVCGATNAISRIDPALLRPGRMERAVEIERPDQAGTLNILRFHVRGDVDEKDLEEIAVMTERSTGAELMHLVRESRRIARLAGRPLRADDLRDAWLSDEEYSDGILERVCLHEAGHAVANIALGCGEVRRVSIRSTENSMAHAMVKLTDASLRTRERIERQVVAVLAGRAAERVILSAESDGSGGDDTSDLAKATCIVAALHGSYGMGASCTYLGDDKEILRVVRGDPLLRATVDRELRALQQRADDLVRRHRGAVTAMADALRIKRTLTGEAIRQICDAHAVSIIIPAVS